MTSLPKNSATLTSLVSVKIDLLFESQLLAGGSAFFYEHNGQNYLVTNWHNVTGRDPLTKKAKHSCAAIPDKIRIAIPGVYEGGMLKFIDVELGLYRDEDRKIPIWWEHPVHFEKVDLAVIPIGNALQKGLLRAIKMVTANGHNVSNSEVQFRAGQDVFIIGFPRLMDGEGLAIWKRGSIATEPTIELGGLPKLYIDTATREGMSGSPVFASGLISTRTSGQQISGLAIRNRFLGIYSGRVGDDTFLAQLGVVWKESAIVETILGKMVGNSSF